MNLSEAKALEDAGKRIVETITLHILATEDIFDVTGKWCAFRLDDGTSDGKTYTDKDEAIRYQEPREREYCYLKIPPDGISIKHAMGYLRANRHPMVDVLSPEHRINKIVFPQAPTLLNPEYSE